MSSDAHLKLSLLGGFEACLEAGDGLVVPSKKNQALLAYLALPLGQSHARETLATLLWGDMQHAEARGNLRQALCRIKKALPAVIHDSLVVDGTNVSLDPSAVRVDVARFEQLIAEGSAGTLGQINALYRGDLLAGLTLAERPFDEWLIAERERLHEMAIQGLGRLFTYQQEAHDLEPALETGLRLLTLDPLQEPVHRAVMRLYAQLGRRHAALRQYELCVAALKRELSAPPEPETTQLYHHILAARSAHPGRPAESTPAVPSAAPISTNLPASISALIGRDTETRHVVDLMTRNRLVTLTGVGGIGKTRLALEVALHLLPDFVDGVWLAELAPLSDPSLVPVTVAIALELSLPAGAESPERVAAALAQKRLLLVLDNCEHLVDAAARMADLLLRAAPYARVLVTSREPLRVPGEYVYRVPSLEVPAEDTADREQLLQNPAVMLFVASAQTLDTRFSPDGRAAAITGMVCRRLDGIPLAIELAAARAATLGLDELAARLDDRFRLLTGGFRTALPRHQTLRATLDWSYELLPPTEQTALRRLAIFTGGFTLDAASAVAAGHDADAPEMIDIVMNLAAKSLIALEMVDDVRQYHLLETTKVYALEKLRDSGEFDQVARRHAQHYQAVFERAQAEWDRPAREWLAVYGGHIDNVRTALSWAFSPNGDAAIGVALTTSALPFWFHQSLLLECCDRVERALSSLAGDPERDRRREMQLRTALLVALMESRGTTPDTLEAWTTAFHIAEDLDDIAYQLAALWGLWLVHITRGRAHAAIGLLDRMVGLATNPVDRLHGERMLGASLHYLGDQPNARRILEGVVSRHVEPTRRSRAVPFQYGRPNASLILSRIVWLQGFPDQALRLAERNVEDARTAGLPVAVCYALEVASLVSIWSSDLLNTDRYVAALLDYSARHALAAWHQPARCYDAVRLIRRGNLSEGLELLCTALDELRASSFIPYHPFMLGTLAQGQAAMGHVPEALATIDEALTKSERDDERWWIAELLRIKAGLVLCSEGLDATTTAEAHLQDALAWTRRQGALSLELRCATDLARLWHRQRRPAPARNLLCPIYARFTEGFATADLEVARALLQTGAPLGLEA